MNSKAVMGRPRASLSETQIRYAMSCTTSCRQAAIFLNVSYNTFKQCARLYIDMAENKSLMQIHMEAGAALRRANKKAAGTRTPSRADGYTRNVNKRVNMGCRESLEDILAGKHWGYPTRKLRKRLFMSGWVELACESCGYSECRVTDGNFPGLLDFRDNNWRNTAGSNLRILCFNCYFNQVRSPAQSWQGWTYGRAAAKIRWDGRETGYGSKKWKIANGVTGSIQPTLEEKLEKLNTAKILFDGIPLAQSDHTRYLSKRSASQKLKPDQIDVLLDSKNGKNDQCADQNS